MKIIIDAMGGDNAPEEIVKGSIMAIEKIDSEIVLCGDRDTIQKCLKKNGYKKDKITIQHASEVIENDEIPTKAIKTKKDSSIVVGLRLLKEGKGDVFLSAGNTGALMTGALLIVGRMKGVDRPALSPLLPSYTGRVLIVDGGSNANCKPENLLQFAYMGDIYMKTIYGIENPKIGLVNIGTEEMKGNDLTKSTYSLLKESGLNFVGNIEGRDIPLGTVDVAVCDGFVGNVILKLIEGMGKTIGKMLKEEIGRGPLAIIGSLFLLPAFMKFKKRMDYAEYGGALYLGLDKAVIKCHGTSNAKAMMYTIIQADMCIKNQTIEKLRENLKFQKIEETEVVQDDDEFSE